MKALVIAEKKSLAQKIGNVLKKYPQELNYDATVVPMQGHLLGLMMPPEIDENLSVFKEENYPWFPSSIPYKILEGYTKKLFYKIKQEYDSGQYDFIIHAGDPDQEGELLVREVLDELDNKLPVKRYYKNTEIESEILDGLKNLKPDTDEMYENMYQAAFARQTSDYLVGMNLSPTLMLKTHEQANVGRLKTFVIGLICKREIEVENFKPSSTYAIKAHYEGFEAENSEIYNTAEEAEDEYKNYPNTAKIIKYEVKNEKEYAPKLYTLSGLQGDAGSTGLNVEDILDICQSLYEKEYISYPRTSCEYIESQTDLEKLLDATKVFFNVSISKDSIERVKKSKVYINDKKVKESGHQALTPTGKEVNLSELSESEITILKMIYRRFVSIFLPPIIREKTNIELDHDGVIFKANGIKVLDKGFSDFAEKSLKENILPPLSEGQTIDVKEYSPSEKKATKPVRFTGPTLVIALEKPKKYIEDKRVKALPFDCGIGRESTRSNVIKELKDLGYITMDGKSLKPTDKSRRYYDYLLGCELFKADTTMIWEEKLESIRMGKSNSEEFISGIKDYITKEIEFIRNKKIETNSFCKCFNCGNDIVKFPAGYGCTGCKVSLPIKSKYFSARGVKLTDEIAKTLLSTGEADLRKCKSKAGNFYDIHIKAVLEDKWMKFESELIDDYTPFCKCPKCGNTILEKPAGYFCESCDCALYKKDAFLRSMGQTMRPEYAKDFFEKGECKIRGLKFKNGAKGDSLIKVNFDGKYPNYEFVGGKR